MVSEKKIFEVCFNNIALYKHMTPLGHGQFEAQGLDWKDFYRGPLNIAKY